MLVEVNKESFYYIYPENDLFAGDGFMKLETFDSSGWLVAYRVPTAIIC